MSRSSFYVIVCLAGSWLAGCAPLLITTGAVGGYAVSKDSVTIDLDQSWDRIWEISLQETKRLGQIKRQDPENGRIDARIQKTDVVLTLQKLTPKTVRVVIHARKYLLPHVEMAQRLGVAIAHQAG